MSARPPVTFLERLSDVDITAPADGQGLIFNSALVKWQNVAIPGGELATLSDVLIGTPTDGQLLVFVGGSWINYGPLNFSDLLGNIAIAQMANGAGADASHYFRGDNTWAAPPVGTIPATSVLLAGDNGGNATASNFQPFGGGWQIYGNSAGDIALAVRNNLNGSATVHIGTDLSTELLKLRAWCQTATPGMAIAAGNDAAIINEFGNLILATNGGVIKGSNNNGTSERWRFANGMSLGTTTDKGLGTVNVTGGFYVNGNKIGGVSIVTATVDQTATTETAHVTYTVPANSVVVGTTFRIKAWGNIDNGATSITFTPRIRWGGTGGVQLLATPTIVTDSNSRTNATWRGEAEITIRSIGGTGTAVCSFFRSDHSGDLGNSYRANDANSGTTAVTIDTTANKDLVLSWALSATTGTPHIRTIGGTIETIQP